MENLFNNKLNTIKNNMTEVLDYLTKLDSVNFDSYFPLATEKMKNVLILRKELKNEYKPEEIKKNENIEKELQIMAKQIQESYDNVIEAFKIQKNELEIELQKFYNKKKLLIYRR